MKFSIITPTLNDATVIKRTVRSLGAQDYSRDLMEWILIDGASADATLETIKAEKVHPDMWESEANGGFFDALNRGITLATGDVVCFLPAGNELASRGTIYRLSSAFMNSGAACVYSNVEQGVERASGFGREHTVCPGIFHRRKLGWGWCPPLTTICITRDALLKTVLSSGAIFDLSFGSAAGVEWVHRTIGRDRVEPAYLRIPTVRQLDRPPEVESTDLWRALRAHKTGHVLAWLGFKLQRG